MSKDQAHWEVETPEEALLYLLKCNLNTVKHMASLKNRPLGQYNRHCYIAQLTVDFAKKFGCDLSSTMANEFKHYDTIGVMAWANQFKPKQ